MAHEEREQGVALGPLELLEPGGETLVDVEGGTAGLGMGAHRGMLGRRVDAVAQVVAPVAADVVLPALVHRRQLLEQPLHAVGEGLPGGVHAGEQGVAARRRRLLDAQDAAHRGVDVARDVGVPQLAGHELRVAVGVHDQDLGMLGVLRGGGMDVQVPEEAAEGLVLRPGQLLIAEEQHEVLHQRGADGVDGVGGERRAQVDPGHLGPDDRRHRLDPNVILQCGPSVFPGSGPRLHSRAAASDNPRLPTARLPTARGYPTARGGSPASNTAQRGGCHHSTARGFRRPRRQSRVERGAASLRGAAIVVGIPGRHRAASRRGAAIIVGIPGAGGKRDGPIRCIVAGLPRFAACRRAGGGILAPSGGGSRRAALEYGGGSSCFFRPRRAANVICTRFHGDHAAGGVDEPLRGRARVRDAGRALPRPTLS